MSKVLSEEEEDMVPFEPSFPFNSSVTIFVGFSLLVSLKLAKCFCASFILPTEDSAGMVALRALFRINIRSVLVSRFLFSSIV